MPPRQVWLFVFGCWTTIVTALVHVAGHLAGPSAPVNDTERQLTALASTYRFALPGGSNRSLMDFMDGFSLVFALLLATIGGVGLIIRKRASHDAPFMLAVARTFTVSSVALLGISLTKFFIVPTLFIAVMAVCFFCASVQSPGTDSGTTGTTGTTGSR
jgi:hypothetical protein